jgi:hypothetical protein
VSSRTIFKSTGARRPRPQVRQLAAGITELTVSAPLSGEWSFSVGENSSYFGFGECFDRLNHAHTSLTRRAA